MASEDLTSELRDVCPGAKELTDEERRLIYIWETRGRPKGWSYSATMLHLDPSLTKRYARLHDAGDKLAELLKLPEAKEYQEAIRQRVLDEKHIGPKEFTLMISERARDPYDLLSFLPFEMLERTNQKTGEMLGVVPVPCVTDASEIPGEYMPYVKELIWHADIGKFEVVPRETDPKLLAKYAEMIGRANGSFTDRVELTGRDGAPIEQVTAEMSSVEAAELYKRAVRSGSD